MDSHPSASVKDNHLDAISGVGSAFRVEWEVSGEPLPYVCLFSQASVTSHFSRQTVELDGSLVLVGLADFRFLSLQNQA